MVLPTVSDETTSSGGTWGRITSPLEATALGRMPAMPPTKVQRSTASLWVKHSTRQAMCFVNVSLCSSQKPWRGGCRNGAAAGQNRPSIGQPNSVSSSIGGGTLGRCVRFKVTKIGNLKESRRASDTGENKLVAEHQRRQLKSGARGRNISGGCEGPRRACCGERLESDE